ncbi:DLA class II histocompatibility antigen, DR-1 beta chain-like [Passerculus sandwichensis]
MGRGAAAGALLAALVVLGAPPAAGAELSGVFQRMTKSECYFINGTEKVRYVQRSIYNRDQFIMFDSNVEHFVGFTPYGEKLAKRWNSNAVFMEDRRTAVDWFCRCWYKNFTFLTERRGEREAERVPSGPALPVTLEPLKISLGIGPEPSALLVPTPGVSRSSQSLPVPARASISATQMPPDAARSKMLTGIGGFVLGFVFLALGLGFSLRKKVRAGAGGGVPAVAERVRSRCDPCTKKTMALAYC